MGIPMATGGMHTIAIALYHVDYPKGLPQWIAIGQKGNFFILSLSLYIQWQKRKSMFLPLDKDT